MKTDGIREDEEKVVKRMKLKFLTDYPTQS